MQEKNRRRNKYAIAAAGIFLTAALLFSVFSPASSAQNGQAQQDYLNAYLNSVNTLQSQANKYLSSIADGVRQAASRQNNTMRQALLTDGKKIIAAVLEELGRMQPPDELRIYHTKIIDMFIYRNLANNALLENNSVVAERFYKQGSLVYIQALSELKRVFESYSAPQDVIRDLDKRIAYENEMLRQMR